MALKSAYKALARKELLERIYDKMSDEDKRVFIQMSMQDKNADEIKAKLDNLDNKVEKYKDTFTQDLLANISGNAIFDLSAFLFSKLIKNVRL